MQPTDTAPTLLTRARVLAREVQRLSRLNTDVFPATLAIAEGVLAEPVDELQGALAGELALDEELEAEAHMVEQRRECELGILPARENADYVEPAIFDGHSQHKAGDTVQHVSDGRIGVCMESGEARTAISWSLPPQYARGRDRTVTLDAKASRDHGDALKVGCPTCAAGIGDLCDFSECVENPTTAHEARYRLAESEAWLKRAEPERCASCGATLIVGECGGSLGCVKGCLDFTGIGRVVALQGRVQGSTTVMVYQAAQRQGERYGAALDVACPTCHRPAGELCQLGDTDGHRAGAHLARYEAAEEGFVGVFQLDAQLAAEQAFDAERRRYGVQGVYAG